MQKYDVGEIYKILDKNIFVVQVTLPQTCLAETPQAREYALYMLIFLTKLRLGMLIKKNMYILIRSQMRHNLRKYQGKSKIKHKT